MRARVPAGSARRVSPASHPAGLQLPSKSRTGSSPLRQGKLPCRHGAGVATRALGGDRPGPRAAHVSADPKANGLREQARRSGSAPPLQGAPESKPPALGRGAGSAAHRPGHGLQLALHVPSLQAPDPGSAQRWGPALPSPAGAEAKALSAPLRLAHSFTPASSAASSRQPRSRRTYPGPVLLVGSRWCRPGDQKPRKKPKSPWKHQHWLLTLSRNRGNRGPGPLQSTDLGKKEWCSVK